MIGDRIREVRISKGLTQCGLAQKAGIGNVYLGEIERGQKMPSLSTFIKIIEALDVSADYMLRYNISAGRCHVLDEMSWKMRNLTPQQRKTATDILDAYIRNL